MYDKIFKRVEQKYVLSLEKYNSLLKLINEHIEKDKFFKSQINNIYFDNDNYDLIINSNEKPIYKDKIRIRSYGIPKMTDTCFLELKNKYKGIVGKRRIKLTLKEFYEYMNVGKYDNNNQIMKEIDYLINYYKLKPKIFVAYDRLSYKAKDDSDFRITFDFNLRSRKDNLKLEYGDTGKKYFDEDCIIMEIKSLNSMPLWFTKSLSELQIFPSSFSKYGSIYKKEIIEKRSEIYV